MDINKTFNQNHPVFRGFIPVIQGAASGVVLGYVWNQGFTYIITFSCIALLLCLACLFYYCLKYYPWIGGGGGKHSPAWFAILLISVLFITLSLPVFIILWIARPEYPRKAIEISVLFLSNGLTIIYFLQNKWEFPKLKDRIAYFTGTTLFTVTLLRVLLW